MPEVEKKPYADLEEIKEYLGVKAEKYTDKTLTNFALAAKDMIDGHCDYYKLTVGDPVSDIVKVVNKELVKAMLTVDVNKTSERVGEVSFSYNDNRFDAILAKLNYLPASSSEEGQAGLKASGRLI